MEPSENRLNELLDAETFTFKGEALETAPAAVGALRRSDEAVGDVDELRRRMQEDGFLFMPGLLNRDQVVAARGRPIGQGPAARRVWRCPRRPGQFFA